MDNAVLECGSPFARPSFERVGYGSDLREIYDARILAEVNFRRAKRAQAKAVQPTKAAKQVREAEETAYDESLRDINKQLIETQHRRVFLEEELEKAKAVEAGVLRKQAKALEVIKNIKNLRLAKAEMARKRQEAFARKLEARGGKPTGVVKSLSPKQIRTPSVTKAVSPKQDPAPGVSKSISPKTTPVAAHIWWKTGPVRIRYRPAR
jgi:hypothetical protein